MDAIWANRLVAGTKMWGEVPTSRRSGVKRELSGRVESGAVTVEKYEEITGEAYGAV